MYIIPEILSLDQYFSFFFCFSPDKCCRCGRAKPWRNGTYSRKAEREDKRVNPVLIQRYYCPGCKKTFSVLPECLPRKRWYLWSVQQAVLSLILTGASVRSISKILKPSRHTIARWRDWLSDKLLVHKNVLCHLFSELGRTNGLSSFWLACLEKMPLSKAMRLCHGSGVDVP